jgi:hypothetical protein
VSATIRRKALRSLLDNMISALRESTVPMARICVMRAAASDSLAVPTIHHPLAAITPKQTAIAATPIEAMDCSPRARRRERNHFLT